MLFLISKPLLPRTVGHLARVQSKINGASPFAAKVANAQKAWKNQLKNKAFADIRTVLKDMCVGQGICNYCESNEATDIDHIQPKTFFPEKAFLWINYLLACPTCNSRNKLDKTAVFNPLGSTIRHDVLRDTLPPTGDVLMINPRLEDPLQLIDLNLETGIFSERRTPGTREYLKSNYTINVVLRLNDREALRLARVNKFDECFNKLRCAVEIWEANTFTELNAIVNRYSPVIHVDRTQPLAVAKATFISSIRNAIITGPHPTVWKEMQRQHPYYPRILDLFTRFPSALFW